MLGKLKPARDQTRLSNAIQRYATNHPMPEIREAAAIATASLTKDRATRILQKAQSKETDSVVRESIGDTIAERQSEQD